MTDLIDLASATAADLLKIYQELRDQEKAAEQKVLTQVGASMTDLVTDLLEKYPAKESDTSAWVGSTVQGIPVTVGKGDDAVTYSVKLVITDTAASEARKPAFKTTKAKASK